MEYRPMESMQNFYIFAFILLCLLILFYLLMGLLRRRARRSSLDLNLGMSVQDVLDMKRKGLLTEDEARAVREAVARQTREKLNKLADTGVGVPRNPRAGHSAQDELLEELNRLKSEEAPTPSKPDKIE